MFSTSYFWSSGKEGVCITFLTILLNFLRFFFFTELIQILANICSILCNFNNMCITVDKKYFYQKYKYTYLFSNSIYKVWFIIKTYFALTINKDQTLVHYRVVLESNYFSYR